jgi:hypothetical protein
MSIANQVQASPGLYVNAPGQPIPGLQPNESVMAAVSRGALPANVLTTNLGLRDSRPGRAILEVMNAAASDGTGSNLVALGGSPNCAPCGGNSFGAGGFNQTNFPGAGQADILPTAAPVAAPTIPAQPVYQG